MRMIRPSRSLDQGYYVAPTNRLDTLFSPIAGKPIWISSDQPILAESPRAGSSEALKVLVFAESQSMPATISHRRRALFLCYNEYMRKVILFLGLFLPSL